MTLDRLLKPDITDTLGTEGIELKQKGNSLWGLCPLHSEKTSSFRVDPQKQTFHCFGCGRGGDIISFIQHYKGLSFKDALCYLGIDTSREIKPDKRVIRNRELLNAYRQWKNYYSDFLCDVLRMLDKKKLKVKTMKEVEAIAYHYGKEQIWEYHFEIMIGKDEEEKFEIYKEMKANGKEI